MKTIEEYLDMAYTVSLVHDRDDEGHEGWIAEVEELPGCISQGSTPQEAVVNVRDAMVGWLSVAMDDGVDIPEPRSSGAFSGKFLVRVPTTLHAELSRAASKEGVSLNQFVSSILAASVHWRDRGRRASA
ncbi:MAG: toxin-antitoxin system HicB family antitoxin [Candidatus Dormibacteria bacterium]